MKNEMTVFQNPDFGQVRTINRNGEPWFVAADVCRALEIQNHKDAIKRLDSDERMRVDLTDPHGRMQTTNIINEPGLYSLVLGSRKPEAKAFKRWITHEVIPAIRKTGSYSVDEDTITINPKALALIVGTTVAECIKQLHLGQRNTASSPEPSKPLMPPEMRYSTPERRMIYSKNLQKFLVNNGMNQRDLCRMGNFRPASVSMWCNGYCLPCSNRQLIIAEIFQVSPDAFYED